MFDENTQPHVGADLLFVSIVVPVYNGLRTIGLCLDAMQQLDYPRQRYEVIVVDNNSSDGTPDVVSTFPVKLTHERDVQTSYAARNTGIRQAQGEIVAFIDADCIVDPQWLRALVEPFGDPAVLGVLGKVASYQPASLVEEFSTQADPLRKQGVGGLLSMITANVAYRRQVLMQVGGFRSELYTGGDVDLGWRVQQLPGSKVCYAPAAVVYHKHRTTLRGLHKQYHRYGFSEIVLDTLYRGQAFYTRTPRVQFRIMLRQCRALFTYVLSLVNRLGRSIFRGWERRYVAWPVLWFVLESSVLLGKMQGLIRTRLFTQSPRDG